MNTYYIRWESTDLTISTLILEVQSNEVQILDTDKSFLGPDCVQQCCVYCYKVSGK